MEVNFYFFKKDRRDKIISVKREKEDKVYSKKNFRDSRNRVEKK